MVKDSRYDFTEELIGIVDKYADLLSYKDMSEELIGYATRMMLSLERDELSGLKAILCQVVKGMEIYEPYHS